MAWCHVPGTDCPSAQAAEALIWASLQAQADSGQALGVRVADLAQGLIGLGHVLGRVEVDGG